jgi:capsular polysaccharide biosynthesis protein
MDLGSAVRLLVRRWLVLIIGLVLTLGAAAYLYTHATPRYQATARMLLLLPGDARVADSEDSPFLYLPNGLQVLAKIVATAPNSRAFHNTMTAAGLTSQYELGIDPASPTITISVEGSDAENVIATRDRVIQGVQDELLTVQRDENTPRRQLAHTRVYAIEDTPHLVQGDRTRGTLAALGIGGLITLLAAFLVDRAIQLRRERRLRPKDEHLTDDEQVSEDEQLSDVVPVSSDEQLSDVVPVSNDEQPTDGAKVGDADQVPEPEQVAYSPQEEQTVDGWDLYIHEYSPVNGEPAPISERLVRNERGANGLSHDEDEALRSLEQELTNTGRTSSRA